MFFKPHDEWRAVVGLYADNITVLIDIIESKILDNERYVLKARC